MWELFPSKVKISIVVIPAILSFLFFNNILDQTLIRSISFTITLLTISAIILGKYLWKFIYLEYFKQKFCPDFNGKWTVSINSNFEGGKVVEFPIEIEADFFRTRLKGSTTIGRTFTNYCNIIRTEDDEFELEYMYKVYNDTPSKTDTSFYEGAARLRLIDVTTMEMKGIYWTNRCWQNGNNTAGEVKLTKDKVV